MLEYTTNIPISKIDVNKIESYVRAYKDDYENNFLDSNKVSYTIKECDDSCEHTYYYYCLPYDEESFCLTDDIIFKWGNISGANSYDLIVHIDDKSAFIYSTAETYYTISVDQLLESENITLEDIRLKEKNQFYWSVRAKNSFQYMPLGIIASFYIFDCDYR